MLWTCDLTKYGDIIRQGWGVLKSFVNGRGMATFGPVNVAVESVGIPSVSGDCVAFDVRGRITIRNDVLADIIAGNAVRINSYASLILSEFAWPEIAGHTGAIVVRFPIGHRPRVNVPGPDPTVASVTIQDDGTGVIEVIGGPDGQVKY